LTASIVEQAHDFAGTLTRLVRLAVNKEAEFTVVESPDRILVGPKPFLGDDHSRIRMRRDAGGKHAALELRASYKCGPDDEEDTHLQVNSSTIGLWVRPDSGDPRPVFRIEYFRSAHSTPQAHVHIHAESSAMGWVYGRSGQPVRHIDSLHFPLGGRRFRPTLEDFLLFIDREGLYADWVDPAWRAEALASRDTFERLQATATVRTYRAEAIAELERLGYTVTRPPP
jgi:hypothetical protein